MADTQRYLDLVTSQHRGKPKFTAWLTAMLDKLDDIVSLAEEMDRHFDLDNAVGTQLDVVGDMVGRSRVLDFEPNVGVSPVLDDETYRLIIKAKIAMNQWDGTIDQMYEIWNTIFPELLLVLKDNQDMTVDAIVFGVTVGLQRELVSNGYVVPKPQGVLINYAFPDHPVFSYGMDDDNFKGYGEGYWIPYL